MVKRRLDDYTGRYKQNKHKHKAMLYRSCRKKRRYALEEEAKAVRWIESERSGQDLLIYPCEFCNGFHLTKRATTFSSSC